MNQALFLGGPIHGEVRNANSTSFSETVIIPSLENPEWINPRLENTVASTFRNHVYRRVREMEKIIRGYEVYEHESLCEENVKLKARRLDEKLRTVSAFSDTKQHNQWIDERTEISREWGI